MRICVISSTVFSIPVQGYSGLEHLAWQQARGLAAKGHRVSVIAPDGSTCEGCEVIQCGPPGRWDEHAFYGGFPEMREGDKVIRPAHPGYWQHLLDVDVIIDHSWQKHSYMLKAEGRLKAPVLGVMHAPVNTMYQSLPPGVEKPCFVCISKDQAVHFNALFSPAEARVAYNGVDLDYYKPIEGVKRSGRFLFLARFSTIKGPDLAIEACRKAGVGLDLVGDTSITNEPEFLERCKKMCDGDLFVRWTEHPSNGIVLRGPATRGECVWWFSQAHCLLHPNQRFREPFGLAPVEAMACGCPAIAWDYGAMRETMHPELCWLVRSPAELVAKVEDVSRGLLDGVGRPTHRERLREWASQFSVQCMIDRYDELCTEAIDTGGW